MSNSSLLQVHTTTREINETVCAVNAVALHKPLITTMFSAILCSCSPTQQIRYIELKMMSAKSLLVVFMAFALQQLAAATADFEMASGPGTIRGEDRDPFKEGYFTIVISCFLLMIFFIAFMFAVRLSCDKARGNDSRSFFLVA